MLTRPQVSQQWEHETTEGKREREGAMRQGLAQIYPQLAEYVSSLEEAPSINPASTYFDENAVVKCRDIRGCCRFVGELFEGRHI